MLKDWMNQKYRKLCLEAIGKYYNGAPELRADRRENGFYYSVWAVDGLLLEAVTNSHGADYETRIYEYAPR